MDFSPRFSDSKAKGIEDNMVMTEPFENWEEESEIHKRIKDGNIKHLVKIADVLVSSLKEALTFGPAHSSEYTRLKMMYNKLRQEHDVDEEKRYNLEQQKKTIEEDIKTLQESNERIEDEVLQICEEIERLSVLEKEITTDKKKEREEMLSTWNAFTVAKTVYKKNLCCHVRLHDSPEPIPMSEISCEQVLTFSYEIDEKTILSVKLKKIDEDHQRKWRMLGADPSSAAVDEAQTYLHKTNDIRHFLFQLRNIAMKIAR